MAFGVPLTEGSVTELHDARNSLTVASMRFNTNVDNGYIYANRTCLLNVFASPFTYLLDFIYNVFDSVKVTIAFFFLNQCHISFIKEYII